MHVKTHNRFFFNALNLIENCLLVYVLWWVDAAFFSVWMHVESQLQFNVCTFKMQICAKWIDPLSMQHTHTNVHENSYNVNSDNPNRKRIPNTPCSRHPVPLPCSCYPQLTISCDIAKGTVIYIYKKGT